jgi:hypothetical protein
MLLPAFSGDHRSLKKQVFLIIDKTRKELCISQSADFDLFKTLAGTVPLKPAGF